MRAIVPVNGLHAIIDRFDGLIIDQATVIRDDDTLHPGALDALQHLKSAGIRTLVLAISSQSDEANMTRLARLGVGPELYERLLSSGQLLRQALTAQSLMDENVNRRFFMAAAPDDLAQFDQRRLKRTANISDADAVVLLTLDAEEAEDPNRVGWLAEAVKRGLPLYTPRADVNGLASRGELAPGFARVLNRYRREGGEVLLFGKPSGRVFARCLNILDPIENDRIGTIGDQFPSDIMGGREMGIEPIFVGSGAGGLKGNSAAEIAAWHTELTGLCDAQAIFELTVMLGLAW